MMANPVVSSSVPSAATVAALAGCAPHPSSSYRPGPGPSDSSPTIGPFATAQQPTLHASRSASPAHKPHPPRRRRDVLSWSTSIRLVLLACTRGHGLLPFTLAAMGYATGALIVHLHMQHHVTHYLAVRGLGIDWLPVVAAMSALLVGLAYLAADARAGDDLLSPRRLYGRRGGTSRRRPRRRMDSGQGVGEAVVELPSRGLDAESSIQDEEEGNSDDDEHMDAAAAAQLRYSTTRSRGGSSSEYASSLRARPVQRAPGDTSAVDSDDSGGTDTEASSQDDDDGRNDVGDASEDDGDQALVTHPPLFASTANPADAWRRALQFRSKRTLILRCVGALTGINYAVSKIPQIPILLSGTLLALVLAVYYMVDRTLRGLLISLGVSGVGTWVCHVLTSRGYLAFVRPDMAGTIQSWVPVLLLASSVCVGNAARVLVRMAVMSEGREGGNRRKSHATAFTSTKGVEEDQGQDSLMGEEDLDAIPQVFELGDVNQDVLYFDSGVAS